jgi:hypothetical protein
MTNEETKKLNDERWGEIQRFMVQVNPKIADLTQKQIEIRRNEILSAGEIR